jgi:molybdate transport system substrate-binding protein
VSLRFVLALLCLVAPAAFAQGGATLTVFAAASLKNALDEAVGAYEKKANVKVSVAYAASSALARQIEALAPADVFISADLDWMDYLQKRRLIRPETRVNLFGNKLVLITPSGSQARLAIGPGMPIAQTLGDGRLAMADPDSVPAGKYGKAALEALGVWSAVASRVAQAENVRAALAFVARGECPLGIVYQTDAAAERRVRILGEFPAGTYPPIVYPAAVTAASRNPAAPDFLRFLGSPESSAAFEKQGFTILR